MFDPFSPAPRPLAGPEELTQAESQQRPGMGEYLGAMMREGFWATTTGQGAAWLKLQAADDGQLLERQDWQQSPWFRDGLAWDAGMTAGRARALAEIKDENDQRRRIIERRQPGPGETALGFGAAMLGGLPALENFVPIAGPAFRMAQAARLAKAGITASEAAITKLGAIKGRAAIGAVDAGLGTAITTPLVSASREAFGDDVTYAEMLLDIGIGAALGAAIGGAVGVVAQARGAGRARPDQAAEAAATSGGEAGNPSSTTPSRLSASGESGAAMNMSPIEGPELGAQAEPSQISTRPDPSASATSRAIRPSSASSTGPVSTETAGLELLSEIGGMDGSSGKKIVQPTADHNRLFALAEAVVTDFAADLQALAARLPGLDFAGARVKDRSTFDAKRQRKGAERSPATFGDFLGGRLFAASPAALRQAAADLAGLSRVVDREDFLQAARPGGYRALHVQIELANGLSAEVQLLPAPFRELLKGSHKFYADWRDLKITTPQQRQAFRAGQAEWQARFDAAYRVWLASDPAPILDHGAQQSAADALAKAALDIADGRAPDLAAMPQARQAVAAAAQAHGIAARADFNTPGEAVPAPPRPLPKTAAEEHGLDPQTGDFDELADLKRLDAAGKLTDEDKAALAAAEAELNKTDKLADANDAAVTCALGG